LVDGFSQDDSYNYLLNYFRGHRNIEIIRSDINRGYSYGNNLGAIKAVYEGADAVLILNPDVVIINNAIDLMYEALQNSQDLSVVAPRILGTKGEDLQFASKLYTLKGFICSRKPISYLRNKYIIQNRYYKINIDADFCFQGMVSGCCFMIRANDFQSIGFFDKNVFLFYEEDIIAYKLYFLGKLSKIISKAMVFHNCSNSVSKKGEAFIRFHRFLSSQYVLKAYAGLSNFQLFFVSLFHILTFTIISICSKSHRKLYIELLSRIRSIQKQKTKDFLQTESMKPI
jgi:hypothetical protein